jgi:HK97 family phage major capsid protein
MDKISELTSRRNALLAEATLLVNAGLKTQESRAENQRLTSEIDLVQADIDLLTKLQRKLQNIPAALVPPPATKVEDVKSPEVRRAKLNAAWHSYLEGRLDQRLQEHRDIFENTSSDGAAIIPTEFQTEFIAEALKLYAPLALYVRRRDSSNGRPVTVNTIDDRANGLVLTVEGQPVPEADPSFSSATVFTDPLTTGQIKYSTHLLGDSGFSFVDLLKSLAASRIGRGLERILTRGKDTAGTTTPNNPGLVSIASTGVTTTSLASGVQFGDLMKLYDALDPAFLPRAIWQMTSKTRNALVLGLDSTNRSLYVPAPNAGGFSSFMDLPIVINQSLDQLNVASGVPVVLGSLYEGLEMISSEVKVTNLVERYAEQRKNSLITRLQVGSTALAPGALQKLVLAAS